SQKLAMDHDAEKSQPSVPIPSSTATTNLSTSTSPPIPNAQKEVPLTTQAASKTESFEVRTTVTAEPIKSKSATSDAPTPPPTSAPADVSTSHSPPPKAEIPSQEIEKVKGEKAEEIEEVTIEDKEELVDATPSSLFDLSDELVNKLTVVVEKRMQESEEIVALSILSTEGKQVLAIGKNALDYERLETLKEVVATLNPKEFYKELADIEYRGLGHFTLSDFDIYFARANQDYAIAILAVDVSTLMLQNAQRIVDSIRQGLGMMDVSEEAEPEVKKKDLVSDLRSRLKQLSSLSDLDKE
ncbi:MAG: hypothetical protein ACC656_09110, partial [Candidatus Heimdallarchaeota archaeon]